MFNQPLSISVTMNQIIETSNLTKAQLNGLIVSFTGLILLILFQLIKFPLDILPSNDFLHQIQTSNPFTLVNVSLLLINIGLVIIVNSKEAYEDERTERIRNHCFKYSFRNAFAFLILLGIAGIHLNLLVVVLFLLCYYCLLFRLCLYRDSALVYLNDDDQKKHQQKDSRKNIKSFVIFGCVIGLIAGLATAFFYKTGETFRTGMIIGGACSLLWTFMTHWKSEAIK